MYCYCLLEYAEAVPGSGASSVYFLLVILERNKEGTFYQIKTNPFFSPRVALCLHLGHFTYLPSHTYTFTHTQVHQPGTLMGAGGSQASVVPTGQGFSKNEYQHLADYSCLLGSSSPYLSGFPLFMGRFAGVFPSRFFP